jgi:hypothetical protein
MTMESVSFQSIGEKRATHIITACDDTDTCPGCGAGYRVGLSACEYCRTPVRMAERSLPWGVEHGSELVIPASVAASLHCYYQRLYDEAEVAA